MKKHTTRHAHHVIAAAAAATLAGGASAQTAQTTLPPIEITAERRLENIQDVPVSASVLQPEIIDVLNTSGQDVRVLSGRVPSLNIESSFGRAFPRFYIRGYGNTDFRLNASQPVSLVYDDIVQENPILKGFPAFDLERIEVLRGPQGSLFGRNTPAGVVKFDSVRPQKTNEGYGSISYGRFDTVNAEGAGNFRIGDSSAVRLSLLNQTRDDWVRNTYDAGPTQKLEGYRDSAARAQYLYEPTQDLSLLANLHMRDFRGSARLFRANIIQPGTNDFVDGFDEKKISIDGKNRSEVQNYGGNLRLRFGLGGGLALYSITGYETVRTFSRGDIDGGFGAVFIPPGGGPGLIPFSSETADGMPSHNQVTQEVRLESTGPGPFSWQAGVFAFLERYRIESFSYDSLTAGNPQNGYERVRQKNHAYAVFGGVNYDVVPGLKLRGGLRYTRDKKDFAVEDYNSAVFGTLPTLAALQAQGPTTDTLKDSKLGWDASVTYTLTPGANVYGRVARSFRGSSVQGAGSFNPQTDAGPETNTSVEAGIKTDLWERRARVNLAVFGYRVKDLQLTAVGGGSNSNRLLNADKVKGYGFELDTQLLATQQLLLTAAAGYNHTKIDDPSLLVGVCAQCTVTDPIVLDTSTTPPTRRAVIDGNPLPQAPRWTASFTAKFTQPVGAGEVYAFTDWVYRSKINFFLYESTEFTGKSLVEGGLRLGYTWGSGRYDAAAYVRNLTDRIRIVGGVDFNNNTGFINDPRTYGVQFKATF